MIDSEMMDTREQAGIHRTASRNVLVRVTFMPLEIEHHALYCRDI